jgi:hypothetical protein
VTTSIGLVDLAYNSCFLLSLVWLIEFDVRLKKIGILPIGNLLERLKKHDRRCTTIIWLYLINA